MDAESPHIEVRAIGIDDATALHELDYSFEADRIYTLCVRGGLAQDEVASPLRSVTLSEANLGSVTLSEAKGLVFQLLETPVDPPLYKSYREFETTLANVEAKIRAIAGGYVALADGQVAGGILLNIEEWRSVTHIEDIIVGRQFRRYGIGSLLLSCASDWARKQDCWAILLETQNVNYPAIQFYLRNGLEVWSINQYFYPPGPVEHEIAIFMGKKLKSAV